MRSKEIRKLQDEVVNLRVDVASLQLLVSNMLGRLGYTKGRAGWYPPEDELIKEELGLTRDRALFDEGGRPCLVRTRTRRRFRA